jgi:hypothetical protein
MIAEPRISSFYLPLQVEGLIHRFLPDLGVGLGDLLRVM